MVFRSSVQIYWPCGVVHYRGERQKPHRRGSTDEGLPLTPNLAATFPRPFEFSPSTMLSSEPEPAPG